MKYILYLFLSLSYLFSNQTITLFANEYKPPKIWTEDGIHKGILIEIAKEVQKELKVKFDIQTYPWARTYKMSINNKGGILGLSKTKEREKMFDYNKIPLFFDTMLLITKKGKEFKFDKIEDLKGKRIGYCRGCSFGKVFEEAKKYFIPVETDDNKVQRLMLLLRGKIDATLLGPGEIALKTMCGTSKLINYKQFSILKKPLTIDPNYIAFPKKLKRKEFLEKFDIILQEKINEKVIDKIIHKWTNKNRL